MVDGKLVVSKSYGVYSMSFDLQSRCEFENRLAPGDVFSLQSCALRTLFLELIVQTTTYVNLIYVTYTDFVYCRLVVLFFGTPRGIKVKAEMADAVVVVAYLDLFSYRTLQGLGLMWLKEMWAGRQCPLLGRTGSTSTSASF